MFGYINYIIHFSLSVIKFNTTFPKGKSIDKHTKESVKKHNITLLNTPIKSLDGNTPKDAFIAVYGEDLYNKIFDIVNDERK